MQKMTRKKRRLKRFRFLRRTEKKQQILVFEIAAILFGAVNNDFDSFFLLHPYLQIFQRGVETPQRHILPFDG